MLLLTQFETKTFAPSFQIMNKKKSSPNLCLPNMVLKPNPNNVTTPSPPHPPPLPPPHPILGLVLGLWCSIDLTNKGSRSNKVCINQHKLIWRQSTMIFFKTMWFLATRGSWGNYSLKSKLPHFATKCFGITLVTNYNTLWWVQWRIYHSFLHLNLCTCFPSLE